VSSRSGSGEAARAELDRRVADVTSEARRVIRAPGRPDGGSDLEEVTRLIESIESRLAAVAPDAGWRAASEAHAAQLERLTRRYEARSAALQRVREALARLRETTSPGTILTRAPKELCTSSTLDRVLLSLVRDGSFVPHSACFRDDPAGAMAAVEALQADPPSLEYPLIETDLLRRRRASIITDAALHPRVHRPMAEVMGWDSFVAAPVLVRDEVVGVIHADAGPSGRALDVLDADVLWTFATGLGDLYETASLRRTLRRQGSELREFLDWLSAWSSELAGAPIELTGDQGEPPDPPGEHEVVGSATDVDDRLVFEGLLTRRELEVLRLIARGETNSGIAAALVISEGTVKFHVRNIFEKLRVGNRAEAVSRYHRLVRVRSSDA